MNNDFTFWRFIKTVFSQDGLLIILQRSEKIKDFTAFNQLPLTRPIHSDTIRELIRVGDEIEQQRKNIGLFNRQQNHQHMLTRQNIHHKPLKIGYYNKIPAHQHREFERCKINAIMMAHCDFQEIDSVVVRVIFGLIRKTLSDCDKHKNRKYDTTALDELMSSQ